MEWWKREGTWLVTLVLTAFVFRYPFIYTLPLRMDEPLYAEHIEEFIEKPGLVPVFYNTLATWKPILAFAAYAPFVLLFKSLGVSEPDVLYRLPAVFFGVLNAVVMYFLLMRIDFEKPRREVAFLGALIYATMPLSMETERLLLTDAFFVFLINLAMLSYTNAKSLKWLAAAAFLSFLAAWTKTLAALMIPLLAVAYWLWREKNFVKNPLFLASLAGAPLGIASYLALTWNIQGMRGQVVYDVVGRLASYGGMAPLTAMQFVSLTLPWNAFGALGAWRFWRKNAFCSLWLALAAPLSLLAYFMHWYFLPVIPAVAWFAAKYLAHPRVDRLTGFVVVLLACVIFLAATVNTLIPNRVFEEQKEIGVYLQGKNKLLYFGDYASTLVFYALLENKSKDYRIVYARSQQLNESLVGNVTRGNEYQSVGMNEGWFSKSPVSWGTWRGAYEYIATQPAVWGNYSKFFGEYELAKNSSEGSYQVFRRTHA
ncbi:MAG: glycosyltransferase family 39 protein [Candidatus Micrarchaeia archaeon]